MKRTNLQQADFEITIQLNGAKKTLKISIKETTDGVEYFNCNINNKNITQVRKEKDGNWEQIWGNLTPQEVNTVGAAITAKIEV
ncbi:hypothetical protein [Pedobacter heparinus]|uniref:hypothetical protein n=1 Tax=Pedobacter heparinus TaxID=984 RepID=UPI0029310FB6|nr:hypothetical protein [Pedobacter heparinus]